MFGSLASSASSPKPGPKAGIPLTTHFVQALVEANLRLTYSSLAQAAKILHENTSNQQLAQRGAGLVKSLPAALQPFVCRRNGGYALGTSDKWTQAGISWPEDLEDRDLIRLEQVAEAVTAWQEAQGS